MANYTHVIWLICFKTNAYSTFHMINDRNGDDIEWISVQSLPILGAGPMPPWFLCLCDNIVIKDKKNLQTNTQTHCTWG